MSYTPTSPLGVAMQGLRTMLSLSETFQQQTNKDAAGSLPFICYIENDRACFPRASIGIVDGDYEQVAGGVRSLTRPNERIHLYLAVEPDRSLEDEEDRKLKGLDTLLKIVDEVMELAGSDEYQNIVSKRIHLIDEVPLEMRETAGHFYWLEATIHTGDG